jgi:hypothetical protein
MKLSQNPAIFTYDYAAMKETKKAVNEGVIANRFHPRYMSQWPDWGYPHDECIVFDDPEA